MCEMIMRRPNCPSYQIGHKSHGHNQQTIRNRKRRTVTLTACRFAASPGVGTDDSKLALACVGGGTACAGAGGVGTGALAGALGRLVVEEGSTILT
jgi:hypothetical protein